MSAISQPTGPAQAVRGPSTVQNIQALRGVAALLVVWAHLKFPMSALNPVAAQSPLIQTARGAIGLDLFFIISGFVICLTAAKKHHEALDFLLARIARVCPLYFAAFLPAFIIKNHADWSHASFRSAWNGLFYLPIFDFGDYTEPPVGVGWTLSFEMWFYLAFALLLLFCKPGQVALLLPFLFLAIAPFMTLFYYGAWYLPRFLFHPFVLEFACGCIIYHLQARFTGWIPWLLLAFGAGSTLAFSRNTDSLGWHIELLSQHLDLAWWRVLLWGVPAALVVAGLVGLEKSRGYVLPQWLVWMGGISFSLYLTHRFSMAVVANVGQRVGLHNPFLVAAVVASFSVLIAWLCWKWVEQPLTSRAQRWAKKKSHARSVHRV